MHGFVSIVYISLRRVNLVLGVRQLCCLVFVLKWYNLVIQNLQQLGVFLSWHSCIARVQLQGILHNRCATLCQTIVKPYSNL